MHAPPPLRVSVGQDSVALAALAAGCALAAANAVAWLMALAGMPPWALGLTSVGSAVVAAAWAWHIAARRPSPCELAWDGQVWSGQWPGQAARAGRVRVAIDLDAWMLLTFDPSEGAGRRWLALSRRAHRASWALLRGALYCARPADVPSAAPPA